MDNRKDEVKKRYFFHRQKLYIICGLIIAAVAVSLIWGVAAIVAHINGGGQGGTEPDGDNTVSYTESTAAPQEETPEPEQTPESEETPEPEQTPEPIPTETPLQSRGTIEKIPETVWNGMQGISYTPNNNIGYEDLRYLTVPHWNFSGEYTTGHIIVNAAVAEDVINIFEELFNIKYPIEHMEPIDMYNNMQTAELNSLDRASMGNNNTSCFCYRVVAGTSNLSKHALGRAIDLNPKTNPWVNGGSVSPKNAVKYADRTRSSINNPAEWTETEKQAFIGLDTEVYRIFTKYGWEWGGNWTSYQDYQHFQKVN